MEYKEPRTARQGGPVHTLLFPRESCSSPFRRKGKRGNLPDRQREQRLPRSSAGTILLSGASGFGRTGKSHMDGPPQVFRFQGIRSLGEERPRSEGSGRQIFLGHTKNILLPYGLYALQKDLGKMGVSGLKLGIADNLSAPAYPFAAELEFGLEGEANPFYFFLCGWLLFEDRSGNADDIFRCHADVGGRCGPPKKEKARSGGEKNIG